MPRADRQSADDRPVEGDGAAQPLGPDGALVMGELVRHDPGDRRGMVAGFGCRRQDGGSVGDSHWESDCSAGRVSRWSGTLGR